MGAVKQISITLPAEIVDQLEAKVAAGEYRSTSEAIQESLAALFQGDAGFEAWLNEVVRPVHAAMRADPDRGLSSGQIRTQLEKLNQASR